MSKIDFTATINNPERVVQPYQYKMLESFLTRRIKHLKNKFLTIRGRGGCSHHHICLNIRWKFLYYFLYYSCRRISEIVGKPEKIRGKLIYNPFGNYPGLREEDISFDTNRIKFGILKKGHVKRKNYKDKSEFDKARREKGPRWTWIEYPQWFMDTLQMYIEWAKKNNMIGTSGTFRKLDEDRTLDKRIFPYSRLTINRHLRCICYNLDIGYGEPKMRTFRVMDKNGSFPRDGKTTTKTVTKMARNPLSSHLFRHAFANRAIQVMDNPAEVKVLTDLLCHSSMKQTETYLNLFGKGQSNLQEKMKDAEES